MLNHSKLREILTKHRRDLKKIHFVKFNGDAKFATKTIAIATTITPHSHSIDDLRVDYLPEDKTNRLPHNITAGDDGGDDLPKYLQQMSNSAENRQPNEKDTSAGNSTSDTFHRAICPVLIMGQFFAVMPVLGVRDANPRHVRFEFKSLRMLYTILFLFASTLLTLNILKFLMKIGFTAKNFVGVVFFSCVQTACILFLSLATRWPHIIRYWACTEAIFTRQPYQMPRRNLAARIHLAAWVIMLMSIVEHGLFTTSAFLSYKRGIEICAARQNVTSVLTFEGYIRQNYEYAFQLFGYNTIIGGSILVVNGACTFIWNYMDLFIMMISTGIAYRFEQITNRLNQLAGKEVPEAVFIEIREHYVKVSELLDYIDEHMTGIILLSCMNNLYFVCVQLLNIFNKLRWLINYIYFWYSLLYLIGRTAVVFLTAASINDESKGALNVLRRVSSRTWCVEVERLVFEMTTQTAALSGKKFYFLTRRLLFGMAGTIVTYELVLLQFDEPNRVQGLPELCA